jgi:hypothetical protein
MKKYFLTAKEFILENKKQFIVGSAIVLAVAIFIFSLALYSYNTRTPKIVYEPARACDLLTLDEAKTFLGEATINTISDNPVQTGSLTVSKCAYSDGEIDTENAVVAAIVVRSGINDAGIELNKAQFENGKPLTDIELVNGVGDSAYYNQSLGQLNVLKESTWVIISYGAAANPMANTLDDAKKLADKVLN